MRKLVKSWFEASSVFTYVHKTNLTGIACVYLIHSQKATEAHSHTCDEFVCFTLFSERVSNTEKAMILHSFMTEPGDREVKGV